MAKKHVSRKLDALVNIGPGAYDVNRSTLTNKGVVFLRLDEMLHQTNLCIMGPSDKWIKSIMSMFVTKSIDLDMKALDQRHTYPLHCLPKSTNHFQYRKWRNRLQKW